MRSLIDCGKIIESLQREMESGVGGDDFDPGTPLKEF